LCSRSFRADIRKCCSGSISMSGGPASRSRGAPLILMLKRLQHLGSLRLVVRSLASCCALLGGLCGARWLLACSDAVGKIRPSRCSYGSQGIVEPYSIPEQSSARKGENSTSSCWLFRSFIPWNCKFVGNDSKPTSLPPRINLPCCRGSRISSTLRSPVPLLIPCEFLPLWFLTIGDASLLRLIRKHVRLRRNKTRGRDNRWRVRDCRLAKKRIPRGTQACQEKNEQAEVRNEASDSQTIAMEITLIIDCRTSLNKSDLSTFRRHSTGVQRPTTTFPKSNTVFCQ